MIRSIETIIRNAGGILMDYFGKIETLHIDEKSTNDYVTEADKASEAFIINSLKKEFPDIDILAEESGFDQQDSTHYWIIDPLDGTRNFLQGLPFFSISIALFEKDHITHGVIYDPVHDNMYTAERGQGAYKNGIVMNVSERFLAKSFLATGFPFHRKNFLTSYLNSFDEIFNHVGNVRRCGSAALDLAYVADGRFDGFWELGLNQWDFAAGALLVQEAGGVISDFKNTDDYFQTGNIIAGNKKIHTELLDILTKHFN